MNKCKLLSLRAIEHEEITGEDAICYLWELDQKKIVNTEEYYTIDEHLDYYDGWARQIPKWRIAQILHSMDGKIEPDCRAYMTEKRFDELDRSNRL